MLIPKLVTTLKDYTRAQFARAAGAGLPPATRPVFATPTVARETSSGMSAMP